jgi:ssDNA-binding Zn-finger/Zn-ribbon topoisomerase 1
MIEETLCPDCGGKMISRKSSYGNFWGCKNYPECKGTRDVNGLSKSDRAKARGESYEPDSKDEINKYSFKRTR